MNIRKATLADIPRLIELGEKFALDSQKAHGLSINRGKIGLFADTSVASDSYIVLVLEETQVIGLIVAMIVQPFFSDDVVVQELVWYVEERRREGILLLKALETMAKAMGAVKIIAGSKPDYVDMTECYLKLGYRELENQFIKEL